MSEALSSLSTELTSLIVTLLLLIVPDANAESHRQVEVYGFYVQESYPQLRFDTAFIEGGKLLRLEHKRIPLLEIRREIQVSDWNNNRSIVGKNLRAGTFEEFYLRERSTDVYLCRKVYCAKVVEYCSALDDLIRKNGDCQSVTSISQIR